MDLPEGLLSLLPQPSLCFLTTLMPDGAPQMTQDVERNPRVAVCVADLWTGVAG